MPSKVRLSQCMIVKNEEQNIERALSWGKGLVCEQIVVDTGSTDRTVKLAEKMGAKVYYFPWTEDFSAAKNFAVEHASGNWIAFLDADEYFDKLDAEKLLQHLDEYEKKKDESPFIIQCACLQEEESGKFLQIGILERIFRNDSGLCYKGRIHEYLCFADGRKERVADLSRELTIYHTGYTESAIRDGGKTERNIRLLEKEVEENPENYGAWAYLGREFLQAGRLQEAKGACQKVIAHLSAPMLQQLRISAFCTLMETLVKEDAADAREQISKTYSRFNSTGISCPDMEYWIAVWMFEHGCNEEGCYWMENVLDKLDGYKGAYPLYSAGQMNSIYNMLLQAYRIVGKAEKIVKYAVLMLRIDRYQEEALLSLLSLLRKEDPSGNNTGQTWSFLEKLYDTSSFRDKLFLLKSAKLAKDKKLQNLIMESLSDEETKWLKEGTKSSYVLDYGQCEEKYPAVSCVNETDRAFLSLIEKLKMRTAEQLVSDQKEKLFVMKEEREDDFNRLLLEYDAKDRKGRISPDEEDYSAFEVRDRILKENMDCLLTFYNNLGDYSSKRVLLAVLHDWMNLDNRLLKRSAGKEPPYFDNDLIPSGKQDVFADVGAGTGRDILAYYEIFGNVWKRIYCYEKNDIRCKELEKSLDSLERLEIRHKLVSDSNYELNLYEEETGMTTYPSASNPGEGVEAVALDTDILEAITFLKLSAGGMEKEVLTGCRHHIQKEHPKIVVLLNQGYDDLCSIPKLIAGMDSSYQFYLRCYENDDLSFQIALYAL